MLGEIVKYVWDFCRSRKFWNVFSLFHSKKKKFGIVKRVISDNIVKRPMTMTKPSDTCYEAQAVYFTEGGSCTKALIK